jgi:hypothetical protein
VRRDLAVEQAGDDVGTMTLCEDGVARYVADSGDESWFDDQERTYGWVC